MFWKKEVVQVPSDDRIRQLVVEVIGGENTSWWSKTDLFESEKAQRRALTALLARLGYSPHNALAHGVLVPLKDDPLDYDHKGYPHQAPVLDKEV